MMGWSGGKDSVYAYYEILNNPQYLGFTVTCAITTMTDGYNRISGHGVRHEVLKRQMELLGLPLHTSYIPKQSTMEEYETSMEKVLNEQREKNGDIIAFGDIFLKGVKKRRTANLEKIGMSYCSPLWGRKTADVLKSFIDLGFKAYVVCVDSKALDISFAGRTIDEDFIKDLPSTVDPCGENGEYHSFVYDGPIFKEPLNCHKGETVMRESFYFCDILLDN